MLTSWSQRLRSSPRAGVAVVVLPLLVIAGCAGERGPVALPLSDFVAGNDTIVGTGSIVPPAPGGADLFREGWRVAGEGDFAVHEVVGRRGELRVFSAAPGAAVLRLEARIGDEFAGLDGGRMVVRVNDVPVSTLTLEAEWHELEIELPADRIHAGWNLVMMRFPYAPLLEGNTIDPEGPVAARFRQVELLTPAARASWPERPARVTVSTSEEQAAPAVVMPTGSAMAAVVEASAGMSFGGDVEVDPVGRDDAEVAVVVGVVDATGERHEVLARSASVSAFGSASFDVDLSRWAGELVSIELSARGPGNALVRWLDAGFRGADIAPLRTPGRLEEPPRTGRLGRPDVIVILLDAGRADAFNDDHPPTPNIDALAEAGTRFVNARSPTSWTGQSVPSMLTGRQAEAVGAQIWGSRIPESVPTVAELFTEAGYETVVWSQHPVYRGNRSFRRGFEHVTTAPAEDTEDRGTTPAAGELFFGDRPTFALVHLVPPHGPYTPPEPYRGALTGGYTGDVPVNAPALNQFPRRRDPDELSAEDLRYIRGRYDENVMFADQLVGQIVDEVRRAGRYDDSLIVVLSDHGEAFLEHDEFLHTTLLYEEFVRIPLVMKWPAGVDNFAPTSELDVGLVDLLPTLVDGIGLGDTDAAFQGRSLLPVAFDGEALDRDFFAHTRGVSNPDRPGRPVHALWHDRYKLIAYANSSRVELFDLEADPREQDDLSGPEPLLARYLMQLMRFYRSGNSGYLALAGGGGGLDDLDAETMRRLQALGYLR